MSKAPYIPFYPSDWLAGTRELSAAETGIYITLIAMMYEREAPLDMARDRLARLCGTTPAVFAKTLSALVEQGKIIELDAGLWNERAGIEIEKRAEKSKVASASAKARWENNKENQGPDDANAKRTQCESDANQNQNQNQKEEKKRGRASAQAKDYVFEGRMIRLTAKDYDRWKAEYHGIADFRSALVKADDYYTENQPNDGRWFYRVSRFLEKEHLEGLAKKPPTDWRKQSEYRGMLDPRMTPEELAYAKAHGLS